LRNPTHLTKAQRKSHLNSLSKAQRKRRATWYPTPRRQPPMTSPPSPRLVRTPMQHTGPHLKLCLPCRLRRSSTARLRELTSPACFKPLSRRRGRRRPASRGAAGPRLRFSSRVSSCLSARELRRPCLGGVFAGSSNAMDAAVSARWGASTTCRTSPYNHAALHPGAPLATQRSKFSPFFRALERTRCSPSSFFCCTRAYLSSCFCRRCRPRSLYTFVLVLRGSILHCIQSKEISEPTGN
jgi:hypothetical protein